MAGVHTLTQRGAQAAPGPSIRLRNAVWLGVCAAAVTVLGYAIGSTRAFDYDGSVTVANFIRADSIVDVFTRQSTYNNHLGFSLIEHILWRATGNDAEWFLRLVPILAAGTCVGLLVAWSARRYGARTAVLAGLLLAVNPVFLSTSREVRGYSLLTLCALASTLLLLRLEHRPARAESIGYVVITTLGLVVHLYMVPVVLLQMVWLWSHHGIDRSWRVRWASVVLITASCYIGLLPAMREAKDPTRSVNWTAPLEVAYHLLGRQPIAVTVSALGLVLLVRNHRHSREMRAVALVALIIVAALWLAGPTALLPRFFVWATPGIALATALGLRRVSMETALTAVAAVAALAVSMPGYTNDAFANRAAGPIINQARSRGEHVCGLGPSTETLDAYTKRHVPYLPEAEDLGDCDLLVVIVATERPDVLAVARDHYRYERRLQGSETGGILLSDEPL